LCGPGGGAKIAFVPAAASPVLSFQAISHDFADPAGAGARRVLDDLSFAVRRGQFTTVVGPSGCGKSTLLRLAAGLLRPSMGRVVHAGAEIAGINRQVGFVPQQASLFPWKTLAENVELPLVLRHVHPIERRTRVADMLAQVGLAGFEHHYPHQLSGGMQKRAAIARTLIYAPDVVLMDEPFGALDAQTRMVMQRDLQALCAAGATTVLFITHDLTEAIVLGDNVVLLSRPPTRIKADIAVALPRPRDVFEPFRMPGFTALYEQVWAIFRTEVA
jgi:NitT/TauT family transport system ATP-binding protein